MAGERNARRGALLLAAFATALPAAVTADPIAAVNAVRREGCAGDAQPPLARDGRLADAARRVAAGAPLRDAVDRSGYRATFSALIHVAGVAKDADLQAAIRANYCAQVAAATVRHAGAYTQSGHVWIVLAAPFTVPMLDAAAAARRVLALVNEARAAPRRCGGTAYPAASPLAYAPALERAAAAHARDMARRGALGHRGADGSTPGERVLRAGYRWLAVAENVAAGQRDADAVVRSWLASPGHCANIMSGEFTEMGVAFATDAASEAGIYWAQVFALPERARRK
jgi:uncharacterized protein YkwD